MTEFANFTAEDYKNYQEAEKMFNDNQNCLNYAEKRGYLQGVEDGRAEGRQEGERKMAKKIAQKMLEQGLSHEDVALITGLSASDLEE